MTGIYNLLIEFTGYTPTNDIEILVYVMFSCASFIILLISVPYIITVMSQIFSK